ncbi:hypothetical protein DFH09DRAFT_1071419 [Mycena vulgaris]|nr:hypothetical protein DFH09DRAFT_1071419 [Mycena vulgaris]
MRLTTLLPALSILASGVSAVATPDAAISAARQTALSISPNNCYGAPVAPWNTGCYPGWYYGRPQYAPSGLACLVDNAMVISQLLCAVLELLFCDICPRGAPPPPPPPPPVGHPSLPPTAPPGYTVVFSNLTCASEVWPVPGNYLTFGIVESPQGCANMCDKVSHCKFFNTYHDVNAGTGKNNTTQLTCSLFSLVLTAANATNCGNQQQKPLPSGQTYITDSYGFYKDVATP